MWRWPPVHDGLWNPRFGRFPDTRRRPRVRPRIRAKDEAAAADCPHSNTNNKYHSIPLVSFNQFM